ncbi:hypothetical protein DPMN_180871 [Dreissena polymorpha]|uniref:Uncharacterized protein n=1 Tax=Dreissena polymorpha TaxID=45954 RepID=A0A9D4DCF8_DREPO|nr:hypothetical protein DPMN_180871 [Dreissena polymorpha]
MRKRVYCVGQCGNRVVKAFANSLDPDETPQNVASHLDPNYRFLEPEVRRENYRVISATTARRSGEAA